MSACTVKTWRETWLARLAELRAEYPGESVKSLTEMFRAQTFEQWERSLFELPRETVVPFAVGRSAVLCFGHEGATRLLRHVANFPACLPVRSVVLR